MGLKFPGQKTSAPAPKTSTPAPKGADLDVDDSPAPKTDAKKGGKKKAPAFPTIAITAPEGFADQFGLDAKTYKEKKHVLAGDAHLFKASDSTVLFATVVGSAYGVVFDQTDAAWAKGVENFAGHVPASEFVGDVTIVFGDDVSSVKSKTGEFEYPVEKGENQFQVGTVNNIRDMVKADAMTFLRVNVADLVKLASLVASGEEQVVIGFPSTTPDATEIKSRKNNYLRGAVMVGEKALGFFAVDYPLDTIPTVAKTTGDRLEAIRSTMVTALPSAEQDVSGVSSKMIENIKRRCAEIAGMDLPNPPAKKSKADDAIESVNRQVDEVLAPVTETAKKGGLKFPGGNKAKTPIASTQSTDDDLDKQLELDLDGKGETDENGHSQDSVDIDPPDTGEGDGKGGDINEHDLDLDLD